MSAYKPGFIDGTVIDWHMENLRGEFILIMYVQYQDSGIVTIGGLIHPRLHMSADIVINIDLKNQFIGGYSKKDIDDILVKDDSLLEKGIINQHKSLKDDIN